MGKALDAAYRVRIFVLPDEFDLPDGVREPALARHAEFCREVGADVGDDLKRHARFFNSISMTSIRTESVKMWLAVSKSCSEG